jgi:acylpyruvate hydrolase
MDHVKGYFLGLDMTARELQEKAKKAGLPWSVAKGYDTFSPVGDEIAKSRLSDPTKATLWLNVNGKQRQHGSTSLMLFSVPQLISHLSTIFTLQEGDCIYTGTPSGVGPVVNGDEIECGLVDEVTGDTISTIKFNVASRPAAKL